jgi:hypothetical protein
MTLLILLAQVATDPLSGGAGWAGTGLLGSVLGWLLFVNLPNKDKQILGLVESRDKLVEKLTAEFRESVTKFIEQAEIKDKEKREDFRGSLKQVTDHAEKELTVIVSGIKQDLQKLAVDVTELRKITEKKEN